MGTTWCPDLSADPAVFYVGSAHEKFMLQGDRILELALANLDALNDVQLTTIPIDVSFNYDHGLTPFQRPQRPAFDESQLEFRDPGLPLPPAPTFDARTINIDPAPGIDVAPPTFSSHARPTSPAITAPSPPANPGALTIPDAPGYVLPPVPTFESLNLPTLPAINIPEFDTPAPVFIEPPFNENWTFEPEAYTQTLVNDLTATLRPMIRGSQALPAIIERAIFERGRTRIDVDADRLVDQAFEDCGNRGFTEPQGDTRYRVTMIRQGQLNALGELSRDVLIRQFEESAAQQRFAITQGAALEATLVQLHVEEQRFLLQAASFQRDSAVAVLNARVQVFNLRLAAYQTEASVLRDRIQGELAKVELFRAQIEGERARGEINEQRVRLYVGQLQGVQAMADFYRTQVEAVKVQADVRTQRIEQYRAEVQAYIARWDAYATEWKGYTASVDADGKRADLYSTMVGAAAKRVDTWAATNNANFETERLRMDQHRLNLDVWGRGLQRWDTAISAERARLAAVGQSVDAKARVYSASADVERAASDAANRIFELGLARERAAVDARLGTANLKIQQHLGLLGQYGEIARAKAQIYGQLSASTWSAVNYGASISSGRSKSSSCSNNFTFQGEIADAAL